MWGTATGKNREYLIVLFLVILSIFLNTFGIQWTIPSRERSQFYPTDVSRWYQVVKGPDRLYWTAPFEPNHPDESFILNAMTNMAPEKLDFNPHFFNYPTLYIYMTAVVVKAANILRFVQLQNSKEFYVAHPDQIGRIYLLGRLLAAILSTMGVVLLYFTVRLMFSPAAGFLSALSLAVLPMWVRESHFMMVNAPAAAGMIACALLAVISLKRNSTWALIASAVAAGLAASTKYPAGAIILLPLFVMVKQKRSFLFVFWLGAASLISFLAGTPYLLVSRQEFLQGLLFEGSTKLGAINPLHLFSLFDTSLGNVLFLLSLAGLLVTIRRWRDWQSQFLLLWLIAGLGQSLISDAFLLRYVVLAFPPLAILSGIALNSLLNLLRGVTNPRTGWLAWAACIFLLVPAFGFSLNTDLIMSGKDIREQASDWLVKNIKPGEEVGIFNNLYFDMPSINAEKYPIVDINRLGKNRPLPNVIVQTSVTRQFQIWLPPSNYTPQVFSQQPLSIWTWPVKNKPLDWDITFLNIFIFQNSNLSTKDLGEGTHP